jgi:CBS domain-containing protein
MQAQTVNGGVLVAHAMTTDVVTVGPETSLWEAARLLRDAGISGMPVVDSARRLIGVLSEKDVARALGSVTGTKRPAHLLDLVLVGKGSRARLGDLAAEALQNTTVFDVMSRDPIVTAPEAPLDVAAGIMLERGINRLPVVVGTKLVGILTRHDVLAAST